MEKNEEGKMGYEILLWLIPHGAGTEMTLQTHLNMDDDLPPIMIAMIHKESSIHLCESWGIYSVLLPRTSLTLAAWVILEPFFPWILSCACALSTTAEGTREYGDGVNVAVNLSVCNTPFYQRWEWSSSPLQLLLSGTAVLCLSASLTLHQVSDFS